MVLWRYTNRRIGRPVLLLPLYALTSIGCLAAVTAASGRPGEVRHVLSASLDALCLSGGVAAAAVSDRDPALELLLSLPYPYGRIMARRFTVLAVSGLAAALAATCALVGTAQLIWPVPASSALLIWMSPFLFLSGLGALVALAGGPAAGASAVAIVWTIELLPGSPFGVTPWIRPIWLFLRYPTAPLGTWYWNRTAVTLCAGAFFCVYFWCIRNREWLLERES